MNRGSSNPLNILEFPFRASMRPRFMNRGSYALESLKTNPYAGFNEAPIHESGKWVEYMDAHGVENASMRARFMNRGSQVARRLEGAGCLSFNEAPIHESGK